jgi:hypothetical protein
MALLMKLLSDAGDTLASQSFCILKSRIRHFGHWQMVEIPMKKQSQITG